MSKQNSILNNLVHHYPEAPEHTTLYFRVSSTALVHPRTSSTAVAYAWKPLHLPFSCVYTPKHQCHVRLKSNVYFAKVFLASLE